MKKQYYFWTIFCLLTGLILVSCKKFIEVGAPPTSVNAANVYQDNQTAASVLTGIYTRLANSFSAGGLTTLSFKAETGADNLTLNAVPSATDYAGYYNSELNPRGYPQYWLTSYAQVYACNAAIEGLTASGKLNPAIRQQLMGEALFMRAFYYFYLVNLYGDVPLVLTTNYKETELMSRTPVDQVYLQILKDLQAAKVALTDNYVDAKVTTISAERLRPNKAVATALLARVYLYLGRDADAELEAGQVIGNSAYQAVPLAAAFLANSRETIWALQPVNFVGFNTDEAYYFILTSASDLNNPIRSLYISKNLEQSFEAGDQRKMSWTGNVTGSGITYYFPYKYKVSYVAGSTVLSEYSIVMRIAEQYLIRAEARAKQNKLVLAIEDLDVIRKRAGLPMIKDINPGISQAALLVQILKDRRLELFAEWGHRWFDLKRLGLADQVLGPLKGATWQSTDMLYPIPASEILANGNLIQNPGYTN